MKTRGGRSVRLGFAGAAAATIVVVLVAFSYAILWKARETLHDTLRSVARENLDRVALIAADEDDDFDELIDELEKESGLDYYIVEVEGMPLAVSEAWSRAGLSTARFPAAELEPLRQRAGTNEFIVAARQSSYADRPAYFAIAVDTAAVESNLSDLRWTLVTLLPFAALAALGLGWWLAGRLLSPVHSLVAAIERIDTDRLGERLRVSERDSEFDRIAAAFNRALDRVAESFERLKRFTSDASHELRTPLTAMKAVGEIALRNGASPVHAREAIGSMLEETDRLAHLVDRLLTLTRADAGAYRARFESVDLAQLVHDVGELMRPLAEERGIELRVVAPAAVNRDADAVTLREALVNLVDNALRHTERGGEVVLSCERRVDLDCIEVRDTGCGIAAEHHSRLFDRFYRVDGAITRAGARGGTGLGLAIARWAVDLHGGVIELESAPGRGSTFRIVLPRSMVAVSPP
jgi:heavy metal sensor kinase